MGGEITLPRAGRLRRGYSVVEVDALTDRVAAEKSGVRFLDDDGEDAAPLTATAVALTWVSSQRGGYQRAAVNEFLTTLAGTVLPHPVLDTSDRHLIRNPLFNRPPIGERGYDEGPVDALITLVGEAVEGRRRLMADQVERAKLRLSVGRSQGYDTLEVARYLRAAAALIRAVQPLP